MYKNNNNCIINLSILTYLFKCLLTSLIFDLIKSWITLDESCNESCITVFDSDCLVVRWMCSGYFCLINTDFVVSLDWTTHIFLGGGGEHVSTMHFDLLKRCSGGLLLKSSKQVSSFTSNWLDIKILEDGMTDGIEDGEASIGKLPSS